MKQGLTLTALAQELERQDAFKVDYLAPTDRMHFITGTDASELDLMGTDAEGLRVNDLAHGQIASRLKIPRPFYDRLRGELPSLLDENVNRLLRHHPDGKVPKWMVRTLDGTARAVLSDAYRRIDNFEIATAILPILGEIPGVEIQSCALTETRMYIKAITPRVAGEVNVGDEVCAGVVIKNSEVGVGSFSVAPLIYRLVCKNGMIRGAAGEGMMKQIHLGRRVEADGVGRVFRPETLAADDRAFMLAVGDVVRAAVDEVRFRDAVASMAQAAASVPVTDVTAAVEVLARREGLGEREGLGVLNHLAAGGDLTRWGMLNAVTRYAQDVDSYDRSTELEEMGGKILAYSPRDWSSLVTATS